ncbi:MAG: carbohydrate-binding protein [Clostridium sp.]
MNRGFLKKFLSTSLAVVMTLGLVSQANPFSSSANETKAVSKIPSKVLVGYWHNFNNGTGSIKLRDVSPDWDVINLSFGEGTTPSSGDIRFTPHNATPEEFKEDVKYLQSQGKKVLISIGGEKGQVNLETTAARDNFVRTVSSIIDTYGLDGLDIDFEGHSLYFNQGDKDLKNPTTPVIVNLISALKEICAKYGDDFVLTMAPETFFVQMGKTFYGGLTDGGADRRTGAYLPVIDALRNELDWLQVQYYNSGSIKDLNGKDQPMGNPEFYVALMDMLLKGFPIMGKEDMRFEALRPDQVVLGVPAAVGAGNGYVNNAGVKQAMDAIMNGGTVGGYTITEGYPDIRGLMTWSINWDVHNKFEWSKYFREYLDSLVPPVDSFKPCKITVNPFDLDGNSLISIKSPARNLAVSYELYENEKVVSTGKLTPSLTSQENVTVKLPNRGYGKYSYKVVAVNTSGERLPSEVITVDFTLPTDNPNLEDINDDKVFDILDLTILATKYGFKSGEKGYSPRCDLTGDGIIDIYDIVKVSRKFGTPITPIYPEWKLNVSYNLGDKVTYGGKKYECTYAHTSNEAWVPGKVPTLWKEI